MRLECWSGHGNKPYREFESLSLRHAVWVAEKLGYVDLKIAEIARNSCDVALKTDWRKCPPFIARQAFAPFSLEGTLAVRF